MSEVRFRETFGCVYEDSPQFVRRLWAEGVASLPGDVAGMAAALQRIVDSSSEAERLALIRVHPDLAGRAAIAGDLTDESRGEQASAGLDQCSAAEYTRFAALNTRYREKFGFPFVMAVRGADRYRILDAFERRIDNDYETEFAAAIAEIHKIARMRLEEIAQNG